jgi:hypothetical protein
MLLGWRREQRLCGQQVEEAVSPPLLLHNQRATSIRLPRPQSGQLVYVQVRQEQELDLQVQDPTLQLIRVAGQVCKGLRSATVGNTLTLVGASSREWFVHAYVGTWEAALWRQPSTE